MLRAHTKYQSDCESKKFRMDFSSRCFNPGNGLERIMSICQIWASAMGIRLMILFKTWPEFQGAVSYMKLRYSMGSAHFAWLNSAQLLKLDFWMICHQTCIHCTLFLALEWKMAHRRAMRSAFMDAPDPDMCPGATFVV